jgi:two-component system chemotaxis response regulator CheB
MAAPKLAVRRRNLVVIGMSAGGVEAVPRVLAQLPGNFPAAIMLVQHHGRRHEPSQLVRILQRASTLPVMWAEQGARVESGHVYVAPADTHLTVNDMHVRLSRGPRENFMRPSIDRLFRSAAADHGAQTIGVLLTGMMADGISGLLAIHASGGRTIIQHPLDAEFAELPARALREHRPDATLRIDEIGNALMEMTEEEPASSPAAPETVSLEAAFDRAGVTTPDDMDKLGDRVQQMCPECGGPLWKLNQDRWRCYLGHSVNAAVLLDKSDEQVEAALWSAVRALHERSATWDSLAKDAKASGIDRVANDYGERAREARDQAELARKFMLDLVRRSR